MTLPSGQSRLVITRLIFLLSKQLLCFLNAGTCELGFRLWEEAWEPRNATEEEQANSTTATLFLWGVVMKITSPIDNSLYILEMILELTYCPSPR